MQLPIPMRTDERQSTASCCSLASNSFELLSNCLPFCSSKESFGSVIALEEQPENGEMVLQTLSASLSIHLIKFRNSNTSTKSECYYPDRNAPKLWEAGTQGYWRWVNVREPRTS